MERVSTAFIDSTIYPSALFYQNLRKSLNKKISHFPFNNKTFVGGSILLHNRNLLLSWWQILINFGKNKGISSTDKMKIRRIDFKWNQKKNKNKNKIGMYFVYQK